MKNKRKKYNFIWKVKSDKYYIVQERTVNLPLNVFKNVSIMSVNSQTMTDCKYFCFIYIII